MLINQCWFWLADTGQLVVVSIWIGCEFILWKQKTVTILPITQQRFTRKEDVIRHYNWHKRRDNSLQHGFMRFSPSDDCRPYYPGCTLNMKNTHYHCMQVIDRLPRKKKQIEMVLIVQWMKWLVGFAPDGNFVLPLPSLVWCSLHLKENLKRDACWSHVWPCAVMQ